MDGELGPACHVTLHTTSIVRGAGEIDPATSSTPFIASLVDVLGIIIFVHVAKVIMADVIAANATSLVPP